MKLSKRLEAISTLISKDKIIVDIGTDHAYLPIYLVENKIVTKVLAVDNKKEPLKNAISNINEHSLNLNIVPILSQGLRDVAEDFDEVVISGMGGMTIIEILNPEVMSRHKSLVLGPNNHVYELRKYLMENSYKIVAEKMIKERNIFYHIIKATFNINRECYNEKELFFGPILLKDKPTELIDYLNKNIEILKKNLVLSKKKDEIKTKIDFYNNALK